MDNKNHQTSQIYELALSKGINTCNQIKVNNDQVQTEKHCHNNALRRFCPNLLWP